MTSWSDTVTEPEVATIRETPCCISVLMPAYNARQTIEAAIQSVQAQTLTQWELIVVDDGSTDDTGLMVNAMAQQDARIRLITTAHTGQLAHVRNTGVTHARCPYLAFLDSDDCYEPDALQVLYTYLNTHPNCDLVYGQYVMTDAHDQPFTTQPAHIQWNPNGYEVANLPAHTWENILTSRVSNQMQGLLVRRHVWQAVGGFPEQPAMWCPDFVFFVRVCMRDLSRVHALPQVVFRYRQLPGSMTYHPQKQASRIASVRDEMGAIFSQADIPADMWPVRSRATATQYLHRARPICRVGRFTDLMAVFNQAKTDVHVKRRDWIKLVTKSTALWIKSRLIAA